MRMGKNVVVVAGAGNDNTSAPFYPAALPDVHGRGGHDQRRHASTANTQLRRLGGRVGAGRAHPDHGHGRRLPDPSGTSMAAPFVSGLAGMLLSLHPDWTAAMVRAQIVHTADSIDALNPGYAGQLGSGRINAAQAMQAPVPILSYRGYVANGAVSGRPDFGSGVALAVGVHNDWADATDCDGDADHRRPLCDHRHRHDDLRRHCLGPDGDQ